MADTSLPVKRSRHPGKSKAGYADRKYSSVMMIPSSVMLEPAMRTRIFIGLPILNGAGSRTWSHHNMAKHHNPHEVAPLMMLPKVIRLIIVPAACSGSHIIVSPPSTQ